MLYWTQRWMETEGKDEKALKNEGYKQEDIANDAHWINNLGGDSMNFFELVTLINEEFNITIPDEKFIYLTSVNEFVKLIVELKKEQ